MPEAQFSQSNRCPPQASLAFIYISLASFCFHPFESVRSFRLRDSIGHIRQVWCHHLDLVGHPHGNQSELNYINGF